LDNILIAYEITHYLKKRKKEKVCSYKILYEQAYDRVGWGFHRDMMQKLGIDGRSVELMMKCVTSVKYKIRVNGELIDEFIPKRGLRQGESISYYHYKKCVTL
jgi:hypothetical protein